MRERQKPERASASGLHGARRQAAVDDLAHPRAWGTDLPRLERAAAEDRVAGPARRPTSLRRRHLPAAPGDGSAPLLNLGFRPLSPISVQPAPLVLGWHTVDQLGGVLGVGALDDAGAVALLVVLFGELAGQLRLFVQ